MLPLYLLSHMRVSAVRESRNSGHVGPENNSLCLAFMTSIQCRLMSLTRIESSPCMRQVNRRLFLGIYNLE